MWAAFHANYQCDQIRQNFIIFGNFLMVYLVISILCYFGNFLTLVGKISLLFMTKILSKNIAILPHCQLPRYATASTWSFHIWVLSKTQNSNRIETFRWTFGATFFCRNSLASITAQDLRWTPKPPPSFRKCFKNAFHPRPTDGKKSRINKSPIR